MKPLPLLSLAVGSLHVALSYGCLYVFDLI